MKWRQELWLTIALLMAGTATAAAQAPDYSGFSSSLCIPFSNPQSQPFTDPPQLRFSVESGGVMEVIMDTGSVGLALSYDLIPDYQQLKGSPGALAGRQFLSSSKILRLGTWIPATVTFFGGKVPVATAKVPVLAVEREGVCLNDNCSPDDLPSAAGRNIVYMGVGFGREADHQPDGTPDKNPFLHLATIAGKPVADTFNPGYIIGSTGVTVGLTPQNTGGFGFIKLAPNPQYPGDWMPANMCVQIDGTACNDARGTLLVDTGIAHSYITVPFPVKTTPGVDPSTKHEIGVLPNDTAVVVNIPGLPDPVAVDSFILGQKTPIEPLAVIPTQSDRTPFVNTGRHFLRQFQFLYDARNGYVGLKTQVSGCGG